MRQRLQFLAGLAVVALASACSSGGAGTSVPAGPSTGNQPASKSGAGLDALSRFAPAPNVREVCPHNTAPGFAHCDALVRTDVSGKVGGDIIGYGPPDFQAAYNLPSSTHGSGQTIAIVDAYDNPNVEADLQVYRANYGLPTCTTANGCFQKLNQAGKTGHYPKGDQNWGFEMSLDVDMVSAACPNCNIMVIEGNNNSFQNLGIAVSTAARLGAQVISNSYSGSGATGMARFYDHPGHVILASSGDVGYRTDNPEPAGYPTVVSVGGTTLTKGGSGRGWGETVWGGTGSGCTNFDKPRWQHDTGCPGRTMNDVAADANPGTGAAVYDTYGAGGWTEVGGTSLSSPLLGGVYGLAGNAANTWSSRTLYFHTKDLYDITSGSNGTCSPTYWCTAGPGYDGPTGNGTPNGIGAF